jgi:predicted acyltransferase
MYRDEIKTQLQDKRGLSESTSKTVKPRIASVDQFRGFAIISMIFVNYLGLFTATPGWLRHADGAGLTFADLVAPYFVFIIGLMYAKSYRSRVRRNGLHLTRIHFLKRYALLIVIGAAMSGVGFVAVHVALRFSPETVARTAGDHDASAWASSILYWGVLQAIGAAGIIALLFIGFRSWVRFLGGCILLIIYHLFLKLAGTDCVLRFAHGGPLGALGWGTLLLFSTVIGDKLGSRGKKTAVFWFLGFGILLVSSGLFLGELLPLSKDLVNASYGARCSVAWCGSGRGMGVSDVLSARTRSRPAIHIPQTVNQLLMSKPAIRAHNHQAT